MKKILNLLRNTAILLLITTQTKAQTLYTYTNDETGLPGTVATGVTASNVTPVNGVVLINACGTGYSTDTWSTSTSPFSTSYTALQITLTPTAGYSVTVTGLQFDLGRNPQGPQKMRYAYSTTGGASWINSGTDLVIPSGSCGSGSTFSWDITDFTTTSPILFRIYGWNANNTNGQGRMYNGSISGSACAMQTWYADTDNDGFGDAASTTLACTIPTGYVADNTDCDDTQITVYPGATEICDGLDNDCDGDIDENLVVATIAPADSAITCKGFPITFSTEPCAGCTYQWFKNDNPLAGATDFSYSTTKPAYYSVQVSTPGGCFDVSEHSLLISGFNPNANIYYPNGLNLCAPTPGNNILVKVGYLATNTYQWYKDGLPYTGDGATSWKIYPTETGNYICSITSIDGCNRVTDIATVINSCRLAETTSADLNIYPNPAADNFTVTLNNTEINGNVEIQVVNMVGQIIVAENIIVESGELNYTIQSNNLTAGMYLVKVISEHSELSTTIVINK